MTPYLCEWVGELFGWMQDEPRIAAAVIGVLLMEVTAVVVYEVYHCVVHYVRWRVRFSLACRRRLRVQRERDRQWVIQVLKRRLDSLESRHAN